LEGPCYKVLTYNEKLKRDKYQVRIFRDIVTFESLPKVTGMQDESQLHWGGHIDLPEGEEVAPDPAELEPLTGVPELQTSLDPPGEGEERQLALPVSEGDERYLQLALVDGPVHNPAHQAPRDVVADPEVALQQANTPSEVGGDGRPQRQNVVSSQSPTQQVSNGDLPPPAVDTVVHDPVTPSSLDKEVPPIIHVPAKVVADSQRSARADARAEAHARADARAGGKPTEKEPVIKPSTKVAVPRTKTQRKKVVFDLSEQPPTRTLRSHKNPHPGRNTSSCDKETQTHSKTGGSASSGTKTGGSAKTDCQTGGSVNTHR
jgi:hypothetical protein